jgi:hypothetical protein
MQWSDIPFLVTVKGLTFLFHSSPNIIRVIKPKKMRWVEDVVHMGEMKYAYKILVAKYG